MKAHIWFFSDEQKEEVFDIINFHFNDDFIVLIEKNGRKAFRLCRILKYEIKDDKRCSLTEGGK